MIVEAEKLRVKGSSPKLRSAKKDVAAIDVPLRSEHRGTEEVVSEMMKRTIDWDNMDDSKQAFRTAYKSYNSIRDLMKSYLDMAKGTSVKTGLGQQYQAAINTVAESNITRDMQRVAEILESGGAKQKAKNLYMLREKLMEFRKSEPDVGYSTATSEAKRTKPLEDVTRFIPKLAKGGFVAKRR
jgi:hypothetical protein